MCRNKRYILVIICFIDGVNYELLEKIKNGRTVAAKFDSKELKIKTPNTVVVFSNEKPDVTELYLLHC